MSSPAKIQAVTFDVGGTLIQPWPSVGHVYAEIAAKHGARDLSPELLNRQFAAAWRARQSFDHTLEGWSSIVDATFAGLLTEPPSKTFFPKLYERFAQADAWRIYPDVERTLRALAAHGLKLGVISNWDDRLRPLLVNLGLARSFETIVVSCEVGATKPALAIFQEAAERLSAPPQAIRHVGDSFEMDVQGALTAGFKAVQIERKAKPLHAGQIESLLDLLPLV